MTDTPRTDAARHDEHDPYMAVASECAKLELELNVANDRIKQLELVINDPHALWLNWLRGTVTLPVGIGDVRQYQEHINRLEEAGDKLLPGAAAALMLSEIEAWRKAKEAKP
jgi:hypothetical protein